MSSVKRTSHAVYDLKYHLVWVPKYRKMILKGDLAKRVREVFAEIAERYEFEIDTMEVKEDHVQSCSFVFVSASAIFSGWGSTNHKEYISQSGVQGIS